MRYLFQVSYLGTHYHGWQSQANAVGVQDVIEDALSKLFRADISIVGSGRTDTGVHCVKQFFHADIFHDIREQSLMQRLNAFLPKDIAVHAIQKIKPDAHARYDAYERAYLYKITRVKDPLQVGLAYHFFKDLDLKTMSKAAALLVGTHDFQCFSKVKTDVNHFLCEVKKARWVESDHQMVFNIVANRFLRGMVRAIVGSLLDVGTGKSTIKGFKELIDSKDRKKAGMNVPPEGLYLVDVKYPKGIFLK